MKITTLKAATAALLVVPLATPAALNLLQPSSAATAAPVQRYTTAQQAGCPGSTTTPYASSGSRWYGRNANTTYDARGKTFNQTESEVYPIWLEGQNNCFQGGTIQG